jgi:hypothetical protein
LKIKFTKILFKHLVHLKKFDNQREVTPNSAA